MKISRQYSLDGVDWKPGGTMLYHVGRKGKDKDFEWVMALYMIVRGSRCQILTSNKT